ncbi:MAG TPA: Uma2 family endonuclease [Xanthomonadaceae bacterium]|nr:Uma2 family endonuclease [Xanthomonadaceae bacterium]
MNQAQAIPRLTPYEQLLALPENQVGEIVGGQLYTQPRPAGPHAAAEGAISHRIGGPFRFGEGGPGGWWILPEPEIHFIRDTEVVVPDLAGWRRERMPAIPRDHRFEVIPDWVCEILSPSTAQKDRALKLPLYARYGVAHAWLVDPLARTLEAFELRDGRWLLLGAIREDDPVCFPPFAAVTFSLADLWV